MREKIPNRFQTLLPQARCWQLDILIIKHFEVFLGPYIFVIENRDASEQRVLSDKRGSYITWSM